MRQASNFRRFGVEGVRGSDAKSAKRQPIAAIEVLETRRLLSGILSPTTITLHEQAGVGFTADLGNFVTIAPGTNLHAAISWGDGSFSQGVVKADGAVGIDEINFEVDGTHTYRRAGDFKIQATVYQASPTPTTTPVRLVASFNDLAIVTQGTTILNGTISGTYLAAPTAYSIGAEYIFKGTGTAGVLGPVQAQGNLIVPGPGSANPTGDATGTLTLTSIGTSPVNSGSVTLQITGVSASADGSIPSTLHYVITGGTGAFANASGEGTIAVTLGGGASANSFTFDITSLLPPTPVV
jgi:hypothetical protein